VGDLVITQSDMELFSKVSHDVNPLHMNSDYARRTAFGRPVVFGILGALAAMHYVPARPAQVLNTVTLLFLNPLFVGIPYRVVVTSSEPHDKIEIFDGRRRMVQMTLTYQAESEYSAQAPVMSEATAGKTVPAEWNASELSKGLQIAGLYVPPATPMEQFISRWRLESQSIARSQIVALVWTSYVVGMEIPGKQAAYSRLDMKLFPDTSSVNVPYSYAVELVSNDMRFSLLQLTADLRQGDTVVAQAQISAFLRQETRPCSIEALAGWLPVSQRLQGKVALVIGGSRGLGAALVAALASQGCTVLLNYARSREEAERLRLRLLSMPGEVHLVEGDAADSAWCGRQSAAIMEAHGGLDFLICNASPAIRPLDFAPESVERLHLFVEQSLRLVTVPLAYLMEPLKVQGGCSVVISSLYARTAPAEFPHYVAAKSAIEGLCRAVFAHDRSIRSLLVRPPKLLTDQTNTPMGGRDAVMPEQIAAKVVALLLEKTDQEDVQVVENFDFSA
jgi:NAD(P)-dependent dehydrogenase (short-subunit alcohol dehydrogenase family)/acyl dehydratase